MKNLPAFIIFTFFSFNCFAQSPGYSNPLPYKMDSQFVDKLDAPSFVAPESGLQKNCVVETNNCEFDPKIPTCQRISCDSFMSNKSLNSMNSNNTANFPGMGSNPLNGSDISSQDSLKKNKIVLDQFIEKNKIVGMSISTFNSQYKNNLPKEINSFIIRTIPFNSMVTMDYNEQRLNINLNENKTIKSITIG